MRSGSIPGYRFFPLHFPRLLKLERRVVNGRWWYQTSTVRVLILKATRTPPLQSNVDFSLSAR